MVYMLERETDPRPYIILIADRRLSDGASNGALCRVSGVLEERFTLAMANEGCGSGSPSKRRSKAIRPPTWGEAESEKWKAVQLAIPLGERVGRFVGTIVGPSATALGGILGDQMKAWRAANLDRIAQKWEKRIRERSISDEIIKELPFQNAVLVLEAASMESEDAVQELWARLIASATDIHSGIEITKMHVDLLRSLNGLEAKLLILLFDFVSRMELDDIQKALDEGDEVPSEKMRVALQNLCRLGILTPSISEHEILGTTTFEEWRNSLDRGLLFEEFQNVIERLVMELTNLTGSPLNDIAIMRSDQAEFLTSYGFTRIGWDLYQSVEGEEQ